MSISSDQTTFSNDSEIHGSAGDPITVYAKLNLREGLHLATVETKSTSGKLYSYTWAFRIDQAVPLNQATLVKLSVDPFSIREATYAAQYGNTPTDR